MVSWIHLFCIYVLINIYFGVSISSWTKQLFLVNSNNRRRAKGKPDIASVVPGAASLGSCNVTLPGNHRPFPAGHRGRGPTRREMGTWAVKMGWPREGLACQSSLGTWIGWGGTPSRSAESWKVNIPGPRVASFALWPTLAHTPTSSLSIPCGLKQSHGPWLCGPHMQWITARSTS